MQILELSDFCHQYFVKQVAAGKTQGKKRIFAAFET